MTKEKNENGEARLFWKCEPDVIVKIGVRCYITPFQRSIETYTVLYSCVSAYTVNHRKTKLECRRL